MKFLYTLVKFLLLFYFSINLVYAQVTVTVTINNGSSTTTCDDGIFGGNPDPQWQIEIAGQGNTTYQSSGICFTNTPNQQYNESWNCPSYPATLQVCVRAFEDDGAACVVNRSCLVSNCQNFNVPTPGNSANYNITVGGASTANVNFTIQTTGSYLGGPNDLICNAINLGTLPPGGTLGNQNLSNYNNFCAGSAGDPNPWGGNNDQGVWFQFTTSNTPSATIQLDGYNDPQGLGDIIDMQLALYESSNNTCTGTLTLVREDFDPIIYSESMQVECLLPNTTYFLLVDGDDNLANLFNGQEGYFGLTVVDDGVVQSGDLICDAQNLGAVPSGGSISTPPLSQTNICATDTNDPEPGAWGSDQGVWFQFFAPPSGHVTIDAESDLIFPLGNDAIDLQLAVYGTINGLCSGALTQQESDYDPILFDETLEVRCLVPGDPYWVFVDGSTLNVDGIFDITINDGGDFPAPNDSICNNIFLGAPTIANPITLTNQSNWCANNIQEPIPTNWANEAGVWYTFIAPPSGVVEFDVTSAGGLLNDLAIDLQLAVYDSDDETCTGNLTEIESDYEGAGVFLDEEMVVECLIPGRMYYFFVDGDPGLVDPQYLYGEFDIDVIEIDRPSPLGNDLPCDAVPLGDPTGTPITTGTTSPHTQNNWCATNTGEPVSAVITNPDQTVWYTFVAPSTGNLTIDINQTGIALINEEAINTEVTLFSSSNGTCTGTFSEVETDASLIDFVVYDSDITIECINPGETYWLMIDGEFFVEDEDIDGNFDITLTEDPPQPPTPNDLVCMAIAMGDPFTGGPLTINNQNNLCASDIGDPDPDAFDTDQTVWYTFTSPATGGPYAVEITATSDFPFFTDAVDLQLAVFSSSDNTCNGTFTEIESDYDAFDFPPLNETIEVQCLEPGMTFYLMVDGSFANVQGNFDLEITSIAANPIAQNDLICDAFSLGGVPIGGNINNGIDYYNFCADVEAGEPNPSAFGTDQTVWFTFTAPNYPGPNGTADVTILLESDPNNVGDEIDLQVAVYESSDGTCNGTFTEVDSDYDPAGFPPFDEEIEVTCLDAGQTYWIQVDGSSANIEGYFTIEITDDGGGSRPTNDDICDAINLGPVPASGSINDGVTYTNICSTVEPGEPNPSAYTPDNTVWFSFEAPASGNATIDLDNQGGIDIQVGVFSSIDGTCAGAMVEHDSDYDGIGVLFDEDIELECLIAGQTYWVQVDGGDNGDVIGGAEGDFTIIINDDGGSTVFPYNDTICNAYNFGLINTTQTLTMETNVCASVETSEPGLGSYAQQTVWYEFIAPPSGLAQIDLSANSLLGIDTEIYLFGSSDNTCTGTFILIDSDYDATQALDEEIQATCLIPGNTYWLQIDGTTVVGPDGEFTISIEDPEPTYGTGLPGDIEPPNNACDDATTIILQDNSCVVAGGTWQVENYGSPTPYHNPNNCGVQNCGDTWYQFTIPSTGLALVEGDGTAVGGTLGDYSDMTFVVYSGTCGNLTEIDCESQDGIDPNDFISMEIVGTPGETIFVQVINENGDDDNENYQICISEKCGSDDCLNSVAMEPNVPYCWEVDGAEGEDVVGGEPGYLECSNNSNPDASVYFTFTSDCNGSSITLSIIDAEIGGTCIFGTTPTDGFNISLFQDSTPCDGNPDALIDCQNWDRCDGQMINWQQVYSSLLPNTEYILQIDGFGQFLGSGGDANGFVMIETNGNPEIEAMPLSPVTCSGIDDGSAIATASYGVMPYTFVWDNGVTNDLVTNLSAGVHMVTVYDDAGCQDTTSVIITEPTPIIVMATEDMAAVCSYSSDGSATVSATGGNPAYTYTWDNGETNTTATGLNGGTHVVSVTDTDGCVVTTDVLIGAPPPLVATVTADTDALCNGASNGSATAAGSGDPTTYTYTWDTGATTATATNLNAGTHVVSVTDASGCIETFDILIGEPDLLTASAILASDVLCNGQSDGSAMASATGGTTTYSYIWDNNETTATATNLDAGTHTVSVTDLNGCLSTAEVIIPEPTTISLTATLVSSVSCTGGNDGSATATASGGTPTYTYLWDNGETITTATSLDEGIHIVTVADANNCTQTAQVTITEIDPISIDLVETTDAWCGNANGSITVTTVTGGTPPYNYDFGSGPSLSNTTSGLLAGSYVISVTDANGCLATASATILDVPAQTIDNSVVVDANCGLSDGSATVEVSGGPCSDYNFNWEDAANPGVSVSMDSIATGLPAGTYNVTVTTNCGGGGMATTDIYTEDFQGAPTWILNTSTGTNGAQNNTWAINDSEGGNTVGSCGATGNGDNTLHVTSFFNPSGGAAYDAGGLCGILFCPETNMRSESPDISTIGFTGLTLTFDFIGNGDGLTDNTSLLYSTNGGATFTSLSPSLKSTICVNGQGEWTQNSYALPATCDNINNLRIAFNWTNNDDGVGTDPSFAVNNIVISTMTNTSTAVCSVTGSVTIDDIPGVDIVSITPTSPLCSGENGSAVVVVSGGTAPYIYVWDNAETSATATSLPAGVHSITVTDANGCTDTGNVSILEPDVLVASTSPITSAICFGESNGSATVGVSGGTVTYSYEWDNTETTATATNLNGGIHFVTITDANGCTTTASVDIMQPDLLSATAIQDTEVLCNGESNGTATVTATGGTINYTFEWDNTETTATATGLNAGDHTVSVTDANGCLATALVSITEPLMPIVVSTTLVNPVSCSSESNGSATVTASGGTPPYDFEWDNSETTATATGLNAGNHTITTTDANGCSETASIIITEPDALLASANLNNDVACNGESNGSATATASGGTAPYNFEWDNSETTATATGLNAGTHFVTVTDANGCLQTASIIIGEPASLTTNITLVSDVNCNGESNGSATISASGGTLPYNFEWDNLETTATATGLNAGTHTVTTTDANGCTETATISISEPDALLATLSLDADVNCNGESNGGATATVSGGTMPYTFTWDNGESTASATMLDVGSHSITITDANNCSATASILISAPNVLLVNATQNSPVLCNGESNGSATTTASGGTPPYNFEWDNLETTATATGLNAGNHTVTTTDANGCSETASIVITEPDALLASANLNNDVTCNGESNGSATATASGGTAPYNFVWDNSETTATATGLNAGTHFVTATDANGCLQTASIIIGEPTSLTTTITLVADANCNGESNGSATVSASGGTLPYNFEWDNLETTATATGLNAGTHTVTTTDANGCTETATITISEPDALLATLSLDADVNCNGESNGGATATVSGGTMPYTFTWDNGESTASATMLDVGSHSITITDANNCSATASILISAPNVLLVNATQNSPVLCNGESNGSATTTASGGTPPYNFEWDNLETTATATGLNAGIHTVTTTDANGCSETASIVITEPDALLASANLNNDVACNGESNGSATATASGGTAPYNFVWDNSETTATATGLNAGTHFVTATDANGCLQTASIIIGEPASLTTNITLVADANCNGESNGSATVSASGGTLPYSFEWDNSETTATATGLSAGTHTVTTTDANGCTETASITISEPDALLATLSLDADVNCNGESNGGATATVSGGTMPYTFTWDNGESTASATMLDLGSHSITITDANNCSATASILISAPNILLVNATQNSPVLCNGESNGSATTTASGGTPPYNFEWDNLETTATATGLNAGNHTVTTTDANGCTETASIIITEPDALLASANLNNDAACNGESNGSATATASGGTAPYNFVWDNSETTATATGLNAGTHFVTATDANGCLQTASVVVGESASLGVTLTVIDGASCDNSSDGSATATGSGGTLPYFYMWDNGETTVTTTGLSGGIHFITVSDNNNCVVTGSILIPEPASISLSSMIINNVSCNGESDGSASVIASGGTPGYNYEWDNGELGNIANNLSNGQHTVTVTDAEGCSATSSLSISEPALFIASTILNNGTLCVGTSDGSATVAGSGGTVPYTYFWDNTSTNSTVNSLTTGLHFVTITDANGCLATSSINIPEPSLLSATLGATSVANCIACDGTASVSVTGGTPPYNYLWSNGETNIDASMLCSGINTISITDANNCLATLNVTIGNTSTLVINSILESAAISCNTICDGAVVVTPSGGNPPYTFQWNDVNSQTSASTTGLCAGSYTVSVLDQDGCIAVGNITINEPNALISSAVQLTPVSCLGGSDGVATVNISGGTPPHNYQWSNSSTNATSTGLIAGLYNVTITDQNGCISSSSVSITEPADAPSISIDNTTTSGCSVCSGSATITLTGGTAPYMIEWSNGGTIQNPNDLCAGVNSLTITDANGCTATSSTTIQSNSSLVIATNVINQVSCNGLCDGQATVSATAGATPYTYQWDDPSNQSSSTAVNLCAGSYNVTVTGSDGCFTIGSIVITEPTELLTSTSLISNVSCNGTSDGTSTVSVSGGTPPYSYLWDNTSTNATTSALTTGIHIVSVADVNGCTSTSSINISEPTVIDITLGATTVANCIACDGTAVVTLSGGTPPYNFLWSNGETTVDAIALCSGINTLSVTDANDCLETVSVTIGNTSTLIVNSITETTTISCNGVCDGAITVVPSGGNPPYTYTWDGGQTISTITGLCSGNYVVTISDQAGCIAVGNLSISEPAVLVSAAVQTSSVNCFGESTGSATVNLSGGTPPYIYDWSNGASTQVITGLGSGYYGTTVTDQNGCTASSIVVILEPASQLGILVSSISVSGCTLCSGSAIATASGGTAPYQIEWSNGSTVVNPSNLCAGINTITVTDANGCVATQAANIPSNTSLVLTTTIDNQIDCNSICDGQATVAVSGGATPYSYLWDDASSQNTPTATNLCAGTYNILITGSDGCTATETVIITEPTALFAATSLVTNVSCSGGSDGSASVAPSGGTLPYSYLWENNEMNALATGLSVGTQSVTITDANGCIETSSINITEPTPISITTNSTTNASCTTCNGGASITVTGGTPPFQYIWSNGSTDEDPTDLCSGNNTVTITDVNTCTTIQTISIGNTSSLAINSINENNSILCNGDCNAVATVVPTGGNSPYTYLWNDPSGQTTNTATGLCAGSYSVTVEDADGCIAGGTISIQEPTVLVSATSIIQQINCTGNSDGQAVASASGGTAPYTFVWDNGELQATATLLDAGPHTVSVTDQNGCITINTITLTEPATPPSVSINNITPAGCAVCDGTATASPQGGTPPYTYNWSNGSTIMSPSDLCPGISTLVVTDANGCVATQTANIPSNTSLAINVNVTTPIGCSGICEGVATVSASGGVPPYSYLWNDPAGQTGATATNLCDGSYNVTITGADGCFTVGSILLTEPVLLGATASTISDISCAGLSDGNASVLTIGGTIPYTFNWDNGETNASASQLNSGTHLVSVTDANGCLATSSVSITAPLPLSITINNTTDANCSACDGTVDITVSGGTGIYTYNWSNGSQIEDPTNLCALNNGVTVTDANGCTVTQNVVIGNVSTLAISSISQTASNSCSGACDGQATVVPSSGNPPYSYQWNDVNNQNTATATNLCAGNYSVTVSDAAGCVAVDVITITEPLPIAISAQEIAGISCVGEMDGQASSATTGGTPPYSYAWSNGETTQNATGLPEGAQNVLVIDANGCTSLANVTISGATPIAIDPISITDVSCASDCDGSAFVNVTSGVMPYSYLWNDPSGQTGATATGLCFGTYSVVVTDDNGCQITGTANIGSPNTISLNLSISTNYNGEDISCNGESDGAITSITSGGTAPYFYSWDNGSSTSGLSGIPAGTYSVTVLDTNGCSAVETITISEPSGLSSSINILGSISCAGGNDGALQVESQGGTSPYTYNWNTSENTPTITGLSSGLYVVTVTDANNCTTLNTVNFGEPLSIAIAVSSINTSCNGVCDGSSTLAVSGGTGVYSYQWSNGDNAPSSSNLCAGNYTVTVTDNNNCSQSTNVSISEPGAISVVIDSIQDVTCNNMDEGFISTVVTGGTSPYSYIWNTGQTTTELTNVSSGNYTITVTDVNGCLSITTAIINQPTMVFGQASTLSPICFGDFSGSISVDTAYGGVGPYQYSLDGLSYQMDSTFAGLEAGNYSVYIQDIEGCEFVLNNIIVEHPDELIVEVGDIVELQLGDSIQLEAVVNTNDSLSYTWTPVEGLTCAFCPNPVAQPFETITYMVNVVNADGCSGSDEILITVDKSRNVFIPNAFTPNNDGSNDGFTVFTGGGVSQIKLLRIFDRWGELIFENTDFPGNELRLGWDGTFKGKKLNPGVFIYYIEVDFVDGITIPYKGDVTLIK